MRKSKLVAVILALCLLLPIAASCGGESNGGGSRDEINLTVYSQTANFSGIMGGWGAEILKEKFNVTFTIIDSPAGTFDTRMESGFLGDIIVFGSDGDEYKDAAEAGMLFDWMEDDLLASYGPHIATYFPYALGKNQQITGTIYGFGHNVAGSASDHAAYYYYPHLRWDLYQQLGYPEIKTLEDFIPVLEQMVALEPETDAGRKTYAVSSFPDWDGDMVMMVKSTAALYGWEEFHFGLYNVNTQEWESCLEPDGQYIRALRFYNQLFQRGLFDPDSMTQTWDDLVEKYNTGAAMFNIFEWIAGHFNNDVHKEQGKIMMPVVAQDQKNLADGLNVYGGNRPWAIGASTQYPELCMEIIDWFASPEGTLCYYYGPQGVTWDYDENGEAYLTELGILAQEDGESAIIEYRDYSGTYRRGTFEHNNTTWAQDAVNPESPSGQTFNWKFWDSTNVTRKVYPIEQEWRDWTGYNTPDDWFTAEGRKSVAVASTYSALRKDRDLNTIWTSIQTAIKDGSWRAIYAGSDEEFDAIVEDMIATAYDYGFEQAKEYCENEALRRKAAEDAVTGG